MELILLQKVVNLGGLGDKVNVKPGYGRNFLVPQGKAVPATAANAAPMTKVIEIVLSTSTPSRAAILRSCSQARCARPSGVLLTMYQNA